MTFWLTVAKLAAQSASCQFQALSVRRGGTKERTGLKKTREELGEKHRPLTAPVFARFFLRQSQFRSSRFPTQWEPGRGDSAWEALAYERRGNARR